MKKFRCRVGAMLLALVLALGLAPGAVSAQEPGQNTLRGAITMGDATRQQREALFVEALFQSRPQPAARSETAGLTAEEQALYRLVSEKVQQIAQDGGSAVVQVPNDNRFVQALRGSPEALTRQLRESLQKVLNQLAYQHPENLYWIALDGGYESLWMTYGQGDDSYFADLQITFQVDPAYQAKDQPTTVDSGKLDVARKARDNARQIAREIGQTDASPLEKLRAMKNKICQITDYNFAAASPSYEGGSDPWQIVSVFDGNPKTTVVCEGYAKAFQYLCDLVFPSGDPECLLVSGSMNESAHMWNVVRMDRESYLVDVTGCDMDENTPLDGLFMKSPKDGSTKVVEEGVHYVVRDENPGYVAQNIDYCYSDFVIEMYGKQVLSLTTGQPDPEEYAVFGTVTSFLNESEPVLVELFAQGSSEPAVAVSVTGLEAAYRLENLLPGRYTLQVSKPSHPARAYSVTIADGDVTLDAALFPLGDVLLDGVVDTRDWMRLQDHLQGGQALTGYALSCADTIVDGVADTRDWMRLSDHCQGIPLW